jgi:ABC-2 type transport system ATP-binding protein
MSATPLLQLRDVGRTLAAHPVVTGLNLTLDRGGVLGLLGVNGAGKSTTLRMIAGVLAPSSGQVLLDGRDLGEEPAWTRRLGYLPETPPLYPELRVDEYLAFCARLHGLAGRAAGEATARVIERCGLGAMRRRLCGNLSKGYAQRVGIAQAIVHEPDLIVLDEPASGLDPVQAASIRDLVRELGRDGAVILSTHLLHDVTACCGRVAILHRGRLHHDGTLTDIADAGEVQVSTRAPLDATQWQGIDCVRQAQPSGEGWRVQLTPGTDAAQLAQAIVARGWGLTGLRGGDLESVFLRIASADDTARAA